MKLAVEVEHDGESVSVEVGTELIDNRDVGHVTLLVGAEALRELAMGGWNPDAAKAILWCNLVRELGCDPADPPFPFKHMNFDWGEFKPYLEPDTEMESALAELSEEA